jgi:hypothetical protein
MDSKWLKRFNAATVGSTGSVGPVQELFGDTA